MEAWGLLKPKEENIVEGVGCDLAVRGADVGTL